MSECAVPGTIGLVRPTAATKGIENFTAVLDAIAATLVDWGGAGDLVDADVVVTRSLAGV